MFNRDIIVLLHYLVEYLAAFYSHCYVNLRVFVPLCTSNSLVHVIDCESVHTRGHNLGLYKEHGNVKCSLNTFVCRNINVWNRLPAHVVNSDSVAVFKRRLACVNLVKFCS